MQINSNADLPKFPPNSLPAYAFDQPLTKDEVEHQITVFRSHAQWFHLPLSDPYNFFVAFIERFQHANLLSDPNRAFAIGLLLDFHYLGNAVFDSGNLGKLPDFHEVYTLFPELIQHEEWNERLEQYRQAFVNNEKPEQYRQAFVNADAIIPVNFRLCHYPAEQLMDIFNNLTLCKNNRKKRSDLVTAQHMLQFGLYLEKLEIDFDEQGATLSEQAHALTSYMQNLPNEVVIKLPADLRNFWKCITAMNEEKFSKRNILRFEKLITIAENDQPGSINEAEQNTLKTLIKDLINQRFDLPPYRFFYNAFLKLATYPVIQPLAPVYFWFLFSKHGKTMTARRIKKEVFDPMQLFSVSTPQNLSEERTSIDQQKADYNALNDLCDLFSKVYGETNSRDKGSKQQTDAAQRMRLYFTQKLDLPMCEFIFQRITKTQIYGSSTTSIIGDKRKKAKPLFRGFALIYHAMEHMLDEYAVLLPYRDSLPCSAEQANLFYQCQTGVSDERKIMKYLFEQQDSIPLARKKRLTPDWCRRITKAAFSLEPEKAVLQCIQDFISSDNRLSSYAQQGDLQKGYLHTAIYRLALEREAKQLACHLLEACDELFYTPISATYLAIVWRGLFVCFLQRNTRYQITRLVPQPPIHDVSTLLNLISSYNRSSDCYIVNSPRPKLEGDKSSQDLLKPIFYEPPCDLIKQIMMDIGNEEPPSTIRDRLRKYAQGIYQTIEESIFDGIVMNWDVSDVFGHLSTYNIQALPSEFDIVLLSQIVSPYTFFCNQLRNISHHAFPIIFRIICPEYRSHLQKNVVRVLCRWIYDDGASSIILNKNQYELSYSEDDLNFINDLARDFPPSFLYIESDFNVDLTKHAYIAGICMNIS